MINIAVLGFGNIGSGVVELTDTNRHELQKAVPEGICVKRILDIRSFPGSPYADRITDDFDEILSDPDISIICETMGGKEPARTYTMRALEKGISVCSSNKELVEAFGPELLQTARENHCSYLFEASVGGGIPLLHPLIACLAQEKITSITGILNGTTNYILTQMDQFGAEYADALREAQEKGYAERDPEADVEGHDTGRKIAILSSIMTGKTVCYNALHVEGISKITAADFAYARALGRSIRLLGISRLTDRGLSAMTAPFLIPKDHMLSSVRDVFNGVCVHGETVDDLMFYGRGAGKRPTASAVLADVVSAVLHPDGALPITWKMDRMELTDPAQVENRFLTRVARENADAARKAFDGCIALEPDPIDRLDEYAFVTAPICEGAYFSRLNSIGGVRGYLRIL
ncbi:MAG: homoserine dehydrogenase [Clostridia bacterium]|nr:homoserine dehydrogenase [Clostridia bacterium]